MDNTTPFKECSVCTNNREEAKRWAQGAEATPRRTALLEKYAHRFWKCKCGMEGPHEDNCSEGIGFYPAFKAIEQLTSERLAGLTARRKAQVRQQKEATVNNKDTRGDRFTTTNVQAHSGTRVKVPREGVFVDAIVSSRSGPDPNVWYVTYVADDRQVKVHKSTITHDGNGCNKLDDKAKGGSSRTMKPNG